jgi:hypothetical protein
MKRALFGAAAIVVSTATAAAAAEDPLSRARQLYNLGQFEAAVSAADQARLTPARADVADLVAARAYLERYRANEAVDDLTNARVRLQRLDPQRFPPRERAEYIIGLGEMLYFDGSFGAAAAVFESALQGVDVPAGPGRERALDWWANALDRDAKALPEPERQAVYQQMRAYMQHELATRPASDIAAYWVASAARSQGDLSAAWDAAQAGWARAPLAPDHGTALRADLDRLVLRAILPERARLLQQSPEALLQEWERFKARWRP